ncbi:hypothetical protein JCM10908_001342 [Rhodotorula pacifica]|uniref:uncharacterized protein n=1 Tax=Rhodotorula pacifica TaxID=1495444 RepID=UPI0031704FB6
MPPKKSAAKKKKNLGSARGFATVSVPRRVDPVAEEAAADDADATSTEGAEGADGAGVNGADKASTAVGSGAAGAAAAAGGVNGAGAAGTGADAKKGDWDDSPEALERKELQELAERIKPGCDKEISRIVKVYEYERRMSKTLPSFAWHERDVQRRVLDLAMSETADETPQPVYEPQDKVVAKVATLFGILEQLGFRSERIEECLRKVRTLEIDDCLDWLYLHADADELRQQGPPPETIVDTAPPTPQSRRSPNGKDSGAPSPSPSVPAAKGSPLPAKPSSTPSSTSTTAEQETALRARILAYGEELDKALASPDPGANGSSIANGDGEVEDEDTVLPDANAKYARLKVQLSEIQRAQAAQKRATKGKGDRKGTEPVSDEQVKWMETQVEVLKERIQAVESDYTFRKVDAEKVYRQERTRLDAAQLSARLNGTTLESPLTSSPFTPTATELSTEGNGTLAPSASISDGATPSATAATTNGSTSSAPPSPGRSANGIIEDKDEESLFGTMLDEMPTEETNDQGTSIPVRNMALPKHFSGRTPRISLQDTVRKLDKHAKVTFAVISRSRAVRASVTIRWTPDDSSAPGRVQYFDMQDVACWDQKQAYDYIATVALFAIAMSPQGNGMALNKALPTVFRDLWDDFVAERTTQEEERYRERLKLYKSIAEPRSQEPPSRDPRMIRTEKTAVETDAIKPRKETTPETAERIQQDIYQRQTWPTYQEMLRQRATLPIASYRSTIMDTIENSQCIVLCGETGCGKSTQVPSFILEHEMRMGRDVKIYCTEPRRISAISLAQRVSQELGEPANACGTRNSYVGYSIRLDSAVSASTRIVYATTGIVLRMLEGRESLADITHIIIDEVHERSIDSDFLLIILREILEVRKDLKVILMSATVDAEKIADYMGGCPVVRVPGRTFPVTPYFLEDVVELTKYRLDAHSDSPYVARNKRAYGGKSRRLVDDVPLDDDDDEDETPASTADITQLPISKQSRTTLDYMDHHAINYELIVMLLENLCFLKPDLVQFSSAILVFMPSLESIRRLTDTLEAHHTFGSTQFVILPLHSTISNENQGLVFNVPRHGVRKIVISTNIAETGITIPDITAVIDTGKHREMRFDEKRQISRLVETFIAQSNAAQRRGRAGRVREGVAFHLFTRHRHDNYMQEHPQPEMTRLSLQDLALRIKIMKIGSTGIEETLLKALDPPLVANISRAVSALIEVKALTTTEEITPLGRHLAKLPMDVHVGLFLILSCIFGCLDAGLTIAAGLNSKSPWLTPFGREAEADAVKRTFKVENSDFLTMYNAYCSWREACSNNYEREFCRKSFLSLQNLQQIEELRQQFFSFLVDAGFVNITNSERRELVSTRYGKSRTKFVRAPADLDKASRDPRTVMACLAASMYPKLLVIDPQNGSLRTLANSAPAAIHPSSVNFAPGRRVDFGQGTRFAAFFQAMHTKKLYIWDSGAVDELSVHLLCGNADFQLPAQSISIDRKIRTRLDDPKSALAIRFLREKWREIFNRKMKDPAAPVDPRLEPWLALVADAIKSPHREDDEEKKRKRQQERAQVKLSLTRHD